MSGESYKNTLVTGARFLSHTYNGVLPNGVHGWIQKYVPADSLRSDSAATLVVEAYASRDAASPAARLVMLYDPARARERAPAGSDPWPYGWTFSFAYEEGGEHRVMDGQSVTASAHGLKCAGCHSRAPNAVPVSGVPMVFSTSAENEPFSLLLNVASTAQNLPTPPAIFQQGTRAELNTLMSPLDPSGAERSDIEAFLAFFAARAAAGGTTLPPGFQGSVDLSEGDIAHFPPMDADGDLVVPGAGHFNNSEGCQNCHDAASIDIGPNQLPPMEFWASPVTPECLADPTTCQGPGEHVLAANWSPYGDWSASILGLGSRDPVWHAQIETERHRNPGVPGSAIDNVCFRCHGPMGEKQLKLDTHNPAALFDHCYMYLTGDGEYLDKPECGRYDTSAYRDSALLIRSASLARDGIACGFCHTIGPEDSPTWDGRSWDVFYGSVADYYYGDTTKTVADFSRRVVAGEDFKTVPGYPFTALNQNNLDQIVGPDSALFTRPMSTPPFDYGIETSQSDLYLKGSQICGTCHIVIVPKIPTGYAAGVPVSQLEGGGHPYYHRPEGCAASDTLSGDPITDPCVGLTFEQTTYFEFLNSEYPTDVIGFECQTCHMETLTGNPHYVAQYESYGENREYQREYNRHTLMGINLFVHEMYQQFPQILGVSTLDPTAPATKSYQLAHNLLNGEETIVEFATAKAHGSTGPTPAVEVSIERLGLGPEALTASVLVTNNAGHKFPSGAGFRRGWVELLVLGAPDAAGARDTLWASGVPNAFGAICAGVCDANGGPVLASEFPTDSAGLEPHHETITRQDQVQIYEAREVDDTGALAPRVLSLFTIVKDNRLLPSGWLPDSAWQGTEERLGLNVKNMAEITKARLSTPDPDPYYTDRALTVLGADTLRYLIPRSDLGATPDSVVARIRYQTIPPYYLLARFKDGVKDGRYGPETQRLIYMASRLNLDLGLKSTNVPIVSPESFQVMDGWTMVVSSTGRKVGASGGG